jgi:DNA repair protein RAD50
MQKREKQAAISKAELAVETMQGLASELRTLSGDIEEKKLRLEKVKRDIKEANFEERLSERASKARVMEDKRDSLNSELRGLSLQADARARLDLKRSEMRSRTLEVKNTCVGFLGVVRNLNWNADGYFHRLEMCNSKFRKLVGKDARAENMERETDRISRSAGTSFRATSLLIICGYRDKEHELAEAEGELATVNKTLQTAETTLSQAKSQLKTKRDELKRTFLF